MCSVGKWSKMRSSIPLGIVIGAPDSRCQGRFGSVEPNVRTSDDRAEIAPGSLIDTLSQYFNLSNS